MQDQREASPSGNHGHNPCRQWQRLKRSSDSGTETREGLNEKQNVPCKTWGLKDPTGTPQIWLRKRVGLCFKGRPEKMMREGGAWAERLTYWVRVHEAWTLTTGTWGAQVHAVAPRVPPFLPAVPLAAPRRTPVFPRGPTRSALS